MRAGERSAADRLFAGLHVLGTAVPRQSLPGGWRRDFAAKGVTLHQADCLIAAAAFGAGARLATANVKDFPIAGLTVEDWPAGALHGVQHDHREQRHEETAHRARGPCAGGHKGAAVPVSTARAVPRRPLTRSFAWYIASVVDPSSLPAAD